MVVKTMSNDDWLYNHVKDLDWVSRHAYIDTVWHSVQPRHRDKMMKHVFAKFSPDSLLWGRSTGSKPPSVIVLKDKPKKKAKQRKITEFFKKVAP